MKAEWCVMPVVVAMAMAAPVAAQPDPTTHAQGMVLQGTMQGHADRDAARLKGRRAAPVPPRTLPAKTCRDGWAAYRRMPPDIKAAFERACVR